jgi:hypothetical protein
LEVSGVRLRAKVFIPLPDVWGDEQFDGAPRKEAESRRLRRHRQLGLSLHPLPQRSAPGASHPIHHAAGDAERMRAPKILERDIQRQILDYLKLHRIFHWRQNVGSMAGKYKGKDWFVRFGYKGMPDIFVVQNGECGLYGCVHGYTRIFGIEVKGSKGEQSQAQREFEVEFTRAGGRYILAHSLEDFVKGLRQA